MSGAIHPLPQYAFMVGCLIKKHRDLSVVSEENQEISQVQNPASVASI